MRLPVLLCALLLVLLSGCSDTDEGEETGSGGGESEAPAAVTVSKADLVGCLSDAGLEVEEPAVDYPEALKERDRIVETIEIAGTGDLTGLGNATWYEDEEAAVAGNEAAGLVSTDDVRLDVAGRIAWRWAGEDAAAELIEGCLTT